MRRPSFQFYPADWRSNANLRRCSLAARGAWMDILGTLHDSDDYGVVHWPLIELASAAGIPLKLAKELVQKHVLKGCDSGECEPYLYTPRSGRKDGPTVTLVRPQSGPIWFSSRMVKDEYVRTIRGEKTRFSDDNSADYGGSPMNAPKPPNGDGSSTSSSSSSADPPFRPPPRGAPHRRGQIREFTIDEIVAAGGRKT